MVLNTEKKNKTWEEPRRKNIGSAYLKEQTSLSSEAIAISLTHSLPYRDSCKNNNLSRQQLEWESVKQVILSLTNFSESKSFQKSWDLRDV